jgi:hypothetical protein
VAERDNRLRGLREFSDLRALIKESVGHLQARRLHLRGSGPCGPEDKVFLQFREYVLIPDS